MKAFFALMKLEISGIFSDMFSAGKKGGGKKSIGRGAVISGLMLVMAAALVWFEVKSLDVLISLNAADILLKVLVAASMFLTVVYGLLEVLSRLYFSRDIVIFSYLPVKDFMLYAARLCAHMAAEIAVSAIFILPGTVVFMVRTGFDPGLLARAIVVTVFSPAIPVLFCALISGLISKVPGFWNHKETITTVFSLVLVLMAMSISYFSGQLGGSAVDGEEMAQSMMNLSGLIDRIILRLPPVGWAARALTNGGKDMLLMLLVSFAASLIIIFLFSHGYIADTSRGTESTAPMKKVDMGRVVIRGQSQLKALMQREIREMLRTPAYMVNGLLGPVIMPTMMTVLMLIPFMRLDGGIPGMLEKVRGDGATMLVVCMFVTGIMSMMMGMNSVASTAISREGKRHSLMVSLPVSAKTAVDSKLLSALVFSLAGIIPPPIFCAVVIPGFSSYAFLMFFWGALMAFIGSVLGLSIDLSKPRLDWTNETKAIKSNMNQIIGLLIFFVVLGVDTFLVILMFTHGYGETLIIVLETAYLLLLSAVSYLILRRMVPAYSRIEN